MRQLAIAYIGNGKSVNRYHIPYVQTLPEMFRIKTIYARRITHDTWAAVPDVVYTTDIADVLGDPEVDVVEIGAPPHTHPELARQALFAGKHVLVDKPFAPTEAEAAELFALAERQGVTIQCYQDRRFDSDFLTAQRVLASGKLGHVFEIGRASTTGART